MWNCTMGKVRAAPERWVMQKELAQLPNTASCYLSLPLLRLLKLLHQIPHKLLLLPLFQLSLPRSAKRFVLHHEREPGWEGGAVMGRGNPPGPPKTSRS